MKTMLKIVSVMVLALLFFVPLQGAGATGTSFDGQVIFGQSFTLKSGDTMNGDLLVFGGSATIEKGATVNGSAVLFGGNLTVNGTVNRDMAVIGGTATLGSSAHIAGNLTTVATTLNRADGSKVDGQIYNTSTSWTGSGQNGNVPKPVVPSMPAITPFKFQFNPVISVANAVGQSVGMALLAMLLMLFLAPHADRIAHAILAQPWAAGGIGLLSVVALPIALVMLGLFTLLIITAIVTIPLAIILVVAMVAAGIFGWIAIGYEVGQRFTTAIHQSWHPAFSAGLGTFALTLVAKILTGTPILNCVGWLVPFLLTLAALGAVVMTRFGTQAVVAPLKPVAVEPAKPAEPTNPIEPTKPAE